LQTPKPLFSPTRFSEGGVVKSTLKDFSNTLLEQAFNWTGHNFQQYGEKLKGFCPWHESQSGTAFYVERVDGVPLWRCPSCDIGGSLVEYRHRLNGGNGSPRRGEFVDLVHILAAEVGAAMPTGGQSPVSNIVSLHSPKNSNVANFPLSTSSSKIDDLIIQVDNLIDQDLQRSELEDIIPQLAQKFNRYSGDVWSTTAFRVNQKSSLFA